MKKNCHTNNKKRFFRMQRKATRLILLVVTLLTIIYGSFTALSLGGKIVWTQVKMAYCYFEIQNAESSRDYALAQASLYSGDLARSFVMQAESADERINQLENMRSDMHKSNDSVVAFAAKNDFDFLRLLLGFAVWIALLGVLFIVRRFPAEILSIEEKIFYSILCFVFFILASLFSKVLRGCAVEFEFFDRSRKIPISRTVAKKQESSDSGDGAIIPFRRRIG